LFCPAFAASHTPSITGPKPHRQNSSHRRPHSVSLSLLRRLGC
jgi:hypothetical protein